MRSFLIVLFVIIIQVVASPVVVNFDNNIYQACTSDDVEVNWNGNHNIQETTQTGYDSCDANEYIGSELMSFFNNGHKDIVAVGALEGQTRYFICTLHCDTGSKFKITCPPDDTPTEGSSETECKDPEADSHGLVGNGKGEDKTKCEYKGGFMTGLNWVSDSDLQMPDLNDQNKIDKFDMNAITGLNTTVKKKKSRRKMIRQMFRTQSGSKRYFKMKISKILMDGFKRSYADDKEINVIEPRHKPSNDVDYTSLPKDIVDVFGDDSPVYVPLEKDEAVKLNITLKGNPKIIVFHKISDTETKVIVDEGSPTILTDGQSHIELGMEFTYVGSIAVETEASTETPTTASPTTTAPTEAATTVAATTVAPTTASPTDAPTEAPTEAPTTVVPTEAPTEAPTTVAPTEAPTEVPTTTAPTEAPTTTTTTTTTLAPVVSPTEAPVIMVPPTPVTTTPAPKSSTFTDVPYWWVWLAVGLVAFVIMGIIFYSVIERNGRTKRKDRKDYTRCKAKEDKTEEII